MNPEEIAADAPDMRSADEHVECAIQILDSLERCDRPDLAVEHAKAHLLLAQLKRGAE